MLATSSGSDGCKYARFESIRCITRWCKQKKRKITVLLEGSGEEHLASLGSSKLMVKSEKRNGCRSIVDSAITSKAVPTSMKKLLLLSLCSG